MKMRQFTSVAIGLLSCVLLAGCTTQLQKQEKVQAQVAVVNSDCNNADVLYSNLKTPVDQRVYFMKSGEICYASANS